MGILDWFSGKEELLTRKEKLGERFTSNLTSRKFTVQYLQELNPTIDFSNVEYIYQIGWCGGTEEHLKKLIQLIDNNNFEEITELAGIDYVQDSLGYNPIGKYIQSFVFKIKSGRTFIQLIKGSFDHDDQGKEIEYERDVYLQDIKLIRKRKLVFPV